MTEYGEMLMYAMLAFIVALVFPAVTALVAAIWGYVQSRRDFREVDAFIRNINRKD